MFDAIPIKIPMTGILQRLKKSILNFTWKHKRSLITKTILRKKEECRKVSQSLTSNNKTSKVLAQNRYGD
jgi:hypothetical protein